jgi:MFS family permease
LAQARGRKLVLLAGFVALAVRCLVLAINGSAASIVTCQVLDGISASTVGVMVPLVVADRGGRFNLAMGLVGLAMTAGATFSTAIAGFVTEHWGTRVAFFCLALVAAGGCLLVRFVLSETGHQQYGDRNAAAAVRAA